MRVVRRRPPLTRRADRARCARRKDQSRIPPQDSPVRSLVPPGRQAQRSFITPRTKPASSRATATVATVERLPPWDPASTAHGAAAGRRSRMPPARRADPRALPPRGAECRLRSVLMRPPVFELPPCLTHRCRRPRSQRRRDPTLPSDVAFTVEERNLARCHKEER